MKIGKAGLDIIKLYEQGPDGGPALESYLCPARVWTIGWGHTKGVYMGQHATPQQCDQFLLDDLRETEAGVNRLVRVPITQNQFDALCSFAFNCGLDIDADTIAEGLGDSTLLRKLNAGDYTGAANEFPKWNKAGGVILNGLVMRRADEKALFLTGIGD